MLVGFAYNCNYQQQILAATELNLWPLQWAMTVGFGTHSWCRRTTSYFRRSH